MNCGFLDVEMTCDGKHEGEKFVMMDEKSGAALNSRFVPECGA